jgi:predicted DNA-binding protein (UPF0251 family)
MKQQRKVDQVIEEPTAVYGTASIAAGETVERIRAGLPIVEFVALQELLGLSAEALAQHLAISRSTLLRRRKGGRLDMQASHQRPKMRATHGSQRPVRLCSK